jgi:hypothetical protein
MLRIIASSVFVVAALAALTANAQLIDFEHDPGGAIPTDNAPLNAPYNLTGGGTVTFFFDNTLDNALNAGDTLPLFEATGPDGSDGFVNPGGIGDVPNPPDAAQLGAFFLRQPNNGTVPPPFIIDYNTAQIINSLSGELWDIDGSAALGTEKWFVEVLDAANVTLASQMSPVGTTSGVGTLDARPWTFTFSGLPAGVDKVRITFMGTKTMGLGLAFNNFRPTTVPEPSAALLMALALPALFRSLPLMGRAREG